MYYKCETCGKIYKSRKWLSEHFQKKEHFEGYKEYTEKEFDNYLKKELERFNKK